MSAEQLLRMFLLLRTLYVGKTVVKDFRCKGIWIKEGYAIKQVKKKNRFGQTIRSRLSESQVGQPTRRGIRKPISLVRTMPGKDM